MFTQKAMQLLAYLLEKNLEYENTRLCLSVLSEPNVRYNVGSKPIQQLRDIYNLRAMDAKNYEIPGFGAFVSTLNVTDAEFVRIHSFGNNGECAVFTDMAVSKLIGTLCHASNGC